MLVGTETNLTWVDTHSNVRRNILCSIFVDDLVTAKETEKVGVILECLNHGEETSQELFVVRRRWFSTVQVLSILWSADVKQ